MDEFVEESTDTCYRSGSSWYTDLMCDKGGNGSWLPKRNWAPLVFYILIFLFAMYLSIFDNTLTAGEKGVDMLLSLLFFILIVAVITMLILRGHTGWAWFVALLPFIFFLLGTVFVAMYLMLGGSCPHCYGTCKHGSQV